MGGTFSRRLSASLGPLGQEDIHHRLDVALGAASGLTVFGLAWQSSLLFN